MNIDSIKDEFDLKTFLGMRSSDKEEGERPSTIGDSIRFTLLMLTKMGVKEGEDLWNKAAYVYDCSRPNEYCGQCGSIGLRCLYKDWKNGKSLEDIIGNISFY